MTGLLALAAGLATGFTIDLATGLAAGLVASTGFTHFLASDLASGFAATFETLPATFVAALTASLATDLGKGFDLTLTFATGFTVALPAVLVFTEDFVTELALLTLVATFAIGLALPRDFAADLVLLTVAPVFNLACGLAAFALVLGAAFEPVLGCGAGLDFAVLMTALPILVALETVFNLAFAMREKFRLTNVGDTCGRWCALF